MTDTAFPALFLSCSVDTEAVWEGAAAVNVFSVLIQRGSMCKNNSWEKKIEHCGLGVSGVLVAANNMYMLSEWSCQRLKSGLRVQSEVQIYKSHSLCPSHQTPPLHNKTLTNKLETTDIGKKQNNWQHKNKLWEKTGLSMKNEKEINGCLIFQLNFFSVPILVSAPMCPFSVQV